MDYNGLSISEATQIQNELRQHLRFDYPENFPVHTIAGADISYNRNSEILYAAIVLLDYPYMTLKAYALVTGHTTFPYVPGYLAFREVPTLLKAWDLLPEKPDVLILDGQGILHPRQMGIASHFGVLTQQATIGCGKSSLFGKFKEPQLSKGSSEFIYNGMEPIGYILRTKDTVKPVYISPGYGLSLIKTLQIMKQSTGRYRIPEPTRIAHEIVNDFRTGKLKAGYHTKQNPLTLF